MRRLTCWLRSALLALSVLGATQGAFAEETPLTIQLLDGPADYWAWALSDFDSSAVELDVTYAGRIEGSPRELFIAAALGGHPPDLALVYPADVDRLSTLGLLARPAAQSSAWGIPAGIRLPLLLADRSHISAHDAPPSWDAFFARVEAHEPTQADGVVLDPGDFRTAAEWLLRNGDSADVLQRLHSAPSATRFWQKRWAPTTPTYRRGRAFFALGDTETLRATSQSVPPSLAWPLPRNETQISGYPASVAAMWVFGRDADPARLAPLLAHISSPEFAARTARYRGWAPAAMAYWDTDPLQRLVAESPAWRIVPRLMLRGLDLRVDSVESLTQDAAAVTAAGSKLAGLPTTLDASALAIPASPTEIPVLGAPLTSWTTQDNELVLVAGETRFATWPRRSATAPQLSVVTEDGHALSSVSLQLYGRIDDTDAISADVTTSHDGQWYVDIVIEAQAASGAFVIREDTTGVELHGRVLQLPAPPHRIPALCGASVQLEDDRYDAIVALLLEHRLTPFPLALDPALLMHPSRGPVVLRRDHKPGAVADDAMRAEQAGVLKDMLVYTHDEPTLLHFPHIRNEAPAMRAAGLRVLATHPPTPSLLGAVDVWAVHAALQPTDTPSPPDAWRTVVPAMAAARDRGESVWWYTAGEVQPLPSLQANADTVTLQAAFVRAPALGFDGFMHADAAAWPASGPVIQEGSLGVGEGVLCYPTESGVLPSLRLKHLRDGLFTMSLLEQLRLSLEADRADPRLEAYGRAVLTPSVLPIANQLHPLLHLTRDRQQVDAANNLLREELHRTVSGMQLDVTSPINDWGWTGNASIALEVALPPGGSWKLAVARDDKQLVIARRDGSSPASSLVSLPLQPGWNRLHISASDGETIRSARWHVWRDNEPAKKRHALPVEIFSG